MIEISWKRIIIIIIIYVFVAFIKCCYIIRLCSGTFDRPPPTDSWMSLLCYSSVRKLYLMYFAFFPDDRNIQSWLVILRDITTWSYRRRKWLSKAGTGEKYYFMVGCLVIA